VQGALEEAGVNTVPVARTLTRIGRAVIMKVRILSSQKSVNALVGGEPHEPVDAAGAGQSLELVLASVL
jgi:hypothetical protein